MPRHLRPSSRRRHIAATLVAVSVATSTITPTMLPVAVAESSSGHDISNSNGVKFSNITIRRGPDKTSPITKSGSLLHNSDRFYATISGKSASKGDTITYKLDSSNSLFDQKYPPDISWDVVNFDSDFTGTQKLKLNGSDEVGATLTFNHYAYTLTFLKDIDDFSVDVASGIEVHTLYTLKEGEELPDPHHEESDVYLRVGEGDGTTSTRLEYGGKPYKAEYNYNKPVERYYSHSFSCTPHINSVNADNSTVTAGIYTNNIINDSNKKKIATFFFGVDNGFRPELTSEWRADVSGFAQGVLMGSSVSRDYDNYPVVLYWNSEDEAISNKLSYYAGSPIVTDTTKPQETERYDITPEDVGAKVVVRDGVTGVEFRVPMEPHSMLEDPSAVFIAPYQGRQDYDTTCLVRVSDPDEASKPLTKDQADLSRYSTITQSEIPNLIYGSERIGKGPADSTTTKPRYEDDSVYRTKTITMTPYNRVVYPGVDLHDPSTFPPLPDNMTWTRTEETPSWVTVNKSTGALTVTPPADTELREFEFPVKATMSDGSFYFVPVSVTVNDLAEAFDPSGRTGSVQQAQILVLDPPEGLEDAGTVTVAPKDALPDFITVAKDGRLTAKPTVTTDVTTYEVPLVVTYADGSTDEVTDTVTVKRIGANKVNDFAYPGDGFSVEQGSTAKGVAAQINPNGIPAGTTFTKKSGPKWASVNEADGVVTAAPGRDVDPTQYPVVVTATYPDGTTDEAATLVTVTRRATDAETNRFGYPDGVITAPQGGEDSTVPPTGTLPGTVFKLKDGSPSFVSVDKKTGVVTMRPGAKEKLGKHPVTVIATYPDTSTAEATVVATVTPRITDADTHDFAYPDASITAPQGGTDSTVPPTGTPKGTVFTLPKGTPAFITIDKTTGVVTMAPSKTEKLGKYPVVVTATYPDKSTDTATVVATVTARDTDASKNDFSYPDNQLPVTQGETKSTVPPTGLVPGATAAIIKGGADWLSVDPATGVVTAKPTMKTKPGDYPVEVTVTYPDGSTNTATVVVHVHPKAESAIHEPRYTPVRVKQGESVTVTKPSGVPGSAKVTVTGGSPAWVTVNSDGSMMARPGVDVVVGDYTVPVTITYADGSTDAATETITVIAGDQAKTSNPMFPDALNPITVPQGGTVTTPRPDGMPDGATCTAGADTPDYVTVHEDCSITAAPGWDAEVGDHGFDVVIAYADGSTDTKRTHVNVTPTSMADRFTPSLVDGHLIQGGSVTVPVTFDGRGGVPESVTFVTVGDNPLRSTVDDKGVVSTTAWYADTEAVTRSETEKDYPVAVKVTYADGSSEVIEAKNIVSPGPMLDYDVAYPSSIDLFAGESGHGDAPQLTDKTKMDYQTTRATYELGDRGQSRNAIIEKYGDGNVSIDPDTGVVSFTADKGMEPQTIAIPVTVRFDDGTFREIAQTVVIKPEAGLSSQLSSGNLTPSGSSDLMGIVGAVIGLGALAAIIGQLLHLFAPGVPVAEGNGDAPAPAPVDMDAHNDPNVVVHEDGTVCPVDDHVKGVCRPAQ